MKQSRSYFETRIVQKSDSAPSRTVQSIVENLIDGITPDLFEDDFIQGSGNELSSKFLALYSSSALAANNFSVIKRDPFSFQFLNKSGFKHCNFERKFPTGLGGTPPNIDFVLESTTDIIAFESKYLEHLTKKPIEFAPSYCKKKLSFLSDFWFSLIDSYRGEILQLDVAQLIKHSIGLIKYNSLTLDKKEITLVYIYWTPKNIKSFDTFQNHLGELAEFEDKMSGQNDITFVGMTYDDFWKMYDGDANLQSHYNKVKNRYDIEI